MMFIILFMSLTACLAAGPLDDPAWQDYKLEFGKVYSKEEEAVRYKIWLQNVKNIELHNSEYSSTYTQGQNQFTDMTDEEFKQRYGGCVNIPEDGVNMTSDGEGVVPSQSNKALPPSVDWFKKGYVTKVKNQGDCGSCYAFSAIGALETQWRIKTGKLYSLSEQQIVDCMSNGCKGGWYMNAWEYIRNNGGSQTQDSYPYEGKVSSCRFNRKYVAATCRGYVNVKRDELHLTEAIAKIGPIAVAIDARHAGFRNYKSGIHYEKKCVQWKFVHAVLVVGYGTENGKDYYLVKNSWGDRWGIGGYIKMARNRGNNCGIASRPSYPLV